MVVGVDVVAVVVDVFGVVDGGGSMCVVSCSCCLLLHDVCVLLLFVL